MKPWSFLPMTFGVLLAVPWVAHATDRLVSVNGHAVHVAVIDPGRRTASLPTIVFESGLGDDGTSGWRRVLPLLPKDVRVVRYDRPGLGTSKYDDESPTPRHIATVLHEALAKAGIAPPYVLVGHSLGGARIRMFSAMYPDDVAGLVFVDPTPDFTRARDDELRDVYAPLGLGEKERDELRTVRQPPARDLPKPLLAELDMASAMAEGGFQEFQSLPPLRDVPVVVLAGESVAEWPTSAPVSFDMRLWVGQWIRARNASLSRFASNIPEGTFVATPNSSHVIQNSEPELVAWAINRALYPNVLRRLERAFTAGGVAQLTREYHVVKAYYPHHEVDPEALRYLGNRFLAMDKTAGITLLEMNVKDNPRSARAFEILAAAYLARGQKALALQTYQRALALDPTNENTRRILKTLK